MRTLWGVVVSGYCSVWFQIWISKKHEARLQNFHSDVGSNVAKEVGGLNSQENSLPAFSAEVNVSYRSYRPTLFLDLRTVRNKQPPLDSYQSHIESFC